MSGKTETIDGVEGKTKYEYDNLLRLISTKETRNEESYRNITYSYDDSGNRITEESVEKGITTTKAYTYGEGNILLGYTVTTGTEKTDEVKYEYDENGNLVKEFDIIKNGKACSEKEKLNTHNSYNALNQLVSSVTSEFTVTNEYNAEGLRTGKEVKSEGIDTTTKTNYTYEYDKVIFETDSSDNYIWNINGINLISRQINGEMFYCLYNGHADITRMVNKDGELAEKYYYDEWGVETETLKYGDTNCDGVVDFSDYSALKSFILQETEKLTKEQQIVSDVNGDGTVNMTDANLLKFSVLHPESVNFPADTNKDGFINEKNNIKYAGYFYDAETGLYYLNAWFYDPEIARFIQQDSYSGNILDPLSLNLYTYAQNNPISYYDPTGHSIKSLLKKAKDAVNKAKETVKSVVKKTTTTAKQTVQKAQQTVTKVAISTKNAVVNAANEYKENWNSEISQLKSSGTAGKLFASYSEGLVGNISNTASTLVQFVKDPLGTASECVDFFLQDPLRNNPVAAVGRYYNDIAQASYVGDWETVANRVGSGTVTVLEVVGAEYALNKGVKTLKNKPSSKMSVKTTSVTNDIKTANTASHSGIRTQNRYALTGSEHYENLKSVFGADNVKWETSTNTIKIKSSEIRFSQSSVNGADEIIASMKKNGWKGDPIDVIRMKDGKLTTIDNTRVVAAREAGIDAHAIIHDYSDILPEAYIDRFTTKNGIPNTWGDAVDLRILKQKASFRKNFPYGSDTMERIGK